MIEKQKVKEKNYNMALRNCYSELNIIGVIKSRNIIRNLKICGTYSESTFSTEANKTEFYYI